jgi:hypothetical protein
LRSDDLHRQRIARTSLAITTPRTREEETLKTPYNDRIASSIVTYRDDVDAATMGYQVRRLVDPYDTFVTKRDATTVVQASSSLNTDTFTTDPLQTASQATETKEEGCTQEQPAICISDDSVSSSNNSDRESVDPLQADWGF